MLLKDKIKDKKLILASKSPRRQELMKGAGIDFTLAQGYEAEESYPADLAPREVPLYLARLKSSAYPAPLAEDEILITADTLVALDNDILGKPKDRAEAISMISRLSGREHIVITGVFLRGARESKGFSAESRVVFRDLEQDEIEYYVDTYRPYDKAGAYGIQEWIGYVGVKGIEGSFHNVMGLPIQLLYVNLLNFIK